MFVQRVKVRRLEVINKEGHLVPFFCLYHLLYVPLYIMRKRIKKFTNKFRESWKTFLRIFKREKQETKEAIRILKKLLRKENPTPEEIKFLKSQSADLAKIVAVMSMGAVSMAIPIALEKILNKWNISIMPKDQTPED